MLKPAQAAAESISQDAVALVLRETADLPKLGKPAQAAALAHYAKQCDDSELDLWMSEIKLRAISQIAKLSRELEKGEKVGGAGKFKLPTGGKFKAEQLRLPAFPPPQLIVTSNSPLLLPADGALDTIIPPSAARDLGAGQLVFRAEAVSNSASSPQVKRTVICTVAPAPAVGRRSRFIFRAAWVCPTTGDQVSGSDFAAIGALSARPGQTAPWVWHGIFSIWLTLAARWRMENQRIVRIGARYTLRPFHTFCSTSTLLSRRPHEY